ncbi:MAG: sulfatase-like hydrolase/transferase [Myxococcota bacterium]
MSDERRPPESPSTSRGSRAAGPSVVDGLGVAAARGLAVATVAMLPMALRCVLGGVPLVDGVLAGYAVALTFALPLALVAPRAARGYRGVVGPVASRRRGWAVALWLGLSVILLVGLGALLKAKTNHRGLGGATFGVFGAAAVILAGIVASRFARGDDRAPGAKPTLVAAAVATVLAGVGLVFPALGSAPDAARAALFDLVWFALAGVAVFAVRLPEAFERPVRWFALPLALTLLAAGWYRVETSPETRRVQEVGGAPATVLWALERWTDRDGDGVGAHFGGRDCDEGDAHRHPGAVEVADDGVDSDCDGGDAIVLVAARADLAPAGVVPARSEPPPRATTAALRPSPSAPRTSVAGAVPTGPPPTASAPERARPDIVFVTFDTTGAGHTSLHGYGRDTTPTLKARGAEGVVFEHAYAAGSDTQRALMPMVSCRVLSRTPKSNVTWPRLHEDANTVAERVRGAGYVTGAVTSFTWLRRDRGFDQGFERWDQSAWKQHHPEREATGPAAIAAAKRMYAELAARDAPLFLWVHLFDPHRRYLRHDAYDFGRGDVDRYDSEIRFTDEQLGELIRTVDSGARGPQTVWLVVGSHGEAFGEHDKFEHGSDVYDEMIRVPWVAWGRGVSARRIGNRAVSTLDAAPTILALAGADAGGCDGVSLAGVLAGAPLNRAPVTSFADGRTAVIDYPLKLRVLRRKGRSDRLILFDLDADPGETSDLSAERRDDLKRLDQARKDAARPGAADPAPADE